MIFFNIFVCECEANWTGNLKWNGKVKMDR